MWHPSRVSVGTYPFYLHISDICKVSEVLKFVLFADDTNILATGANLQQLLSLMTSEMDKVKKWFDSNKLSLNININKTKFMLFGKHKSDTNVQIQIEGVNIETVNENTFLGVIVDDRIC